MKKIIICALSALFVLGATVSCGKDKKGGTDTPVKPAPDPDPKPNPEQPTYDKSLILEGTYYFCKADKFDNKDAMKKELDAAYKGDILGQYWQDDELLDKMFASYARKEGANPPNKFFRWVLAGELNSGGLGIFIEDLYSKESFTLVEDTEDVQTGGNKNFWAVGTGLMSRTFKCTGLQKKVVDGSDGKKIYLIAGQQATTGLTVTLRCFDAQDANQTPCWWLSVLAMKPATKSAAEKTQVLMKKDIKKVIF